LDQPGQSWQRRELRLDVRSWVFSLWHFVRNATATAVAAAFSAAHGFRHAGVFAPRQRRQRAF
jgi:hypothetical protein